MYILLCTETTLSKHPVVLPKSSCNIHLSRSLCLITAVLSLNINCALVIKHILIHRYFLFYQVIIKLVSTVKKVRISKHINYALHVFWCSINVICTGCFLSDWFIFPSIKPKCDNKFSVIYLNWTSDCCTITTLRKNRILEEFVLDFLV